MFSKSFSPKQLKAHLRTGLNILLVVATAFMFWSGAQLASNTESPAVVVLSGSMEPAYYRGDVMFIHKNYSEYNIGDVVIFRVKYDTTPIVHRIIKLHTDTDGTTKFLTKGDNNNWDDRGLYGGEAYLTHKDIVGKVYCWVPIVGHLTLFFNDYPRLRYIIIALVILFDYIDSQRKQSEEKKKPAR